MPSGFTSALPSDVLLDVGVLYHKPSASLVILGWVTRGGVNFDPGVTMRNVEFDGKRTPIAELDRVTGYAPKISGTILAGDETMFAKLLPGSGSVTVTTVTTVTPIDASTALAAGDYLISPTVRFLRGNGGTVDVSLEQGLITKWSLKGQDNDEGLVDFEIEGRLAKATAVTSSDTPPFTVVVSD